MASLPSTTDVIIVGGGISGLAFACMLGRAGIRTLLIDPKPLRPLTTQNTLTDGRAYAIAYGSHLILKEAGIWQQVQDQASPILDIRVSDRDSSFFLHYDHTLVGNLPLGYMVPAEDIHNAAQHAAQREPLVTIQAGIDVETILRTQDQVTVTLRNGAKFQALLLIGADGKLSKIRTGANISSFTHNYGQTGIVCTIEHEEHHQFLAQERFLPTGPFAALPLKGGHHSSLVWVERSALAPLYINMDLDTCAQHIQKRIGNYLGKISIVSPRFSYPLTLSQAKRYTCTRLALIGDAAHAIHPLAGQGLNLGIRDIGILTKLIKKQVVLGLDIGSPSVLKEYEAQRKFDSWSLIAITHSLNQLFASNLLPIKIARRLGMTAVHRMGFLKKQLIQHAMGLSSTPTRT
jgi:2-octaprenyl-6-methoxyphenol hydroxylase